MTDVDMTTSLRYYVDKYVCRICYSNLRLHRDENGAWTIVCAADPSHHGAWRKTYLERRLHQERVEFLEIIFDRELRELFPWLPKPRSMTAAKAMTDLYGDRDTAILYQPPRGRNHLFKT